jgi:hypothetical protein
MQRVSNSSEDPASVGTARQAWRWQLIPALGLLLLGIASCYWASARLGTDFASYQAMALSIVKGWPIYDFEFHRQLFPKAFGLPGPNGMFYPPVTGIAVLPLALFDYHVGKLVWFGVMVTVGVLGVRAVVRTARPGSPSYLWVGGAGLVLLCSCVRWGMTSLQGAPLMLGLLCLLVAALHEKRWTAAFLLTLFAVMFKMTMAVPFVGALLLYRRYGAALAAGASSVALNALAFARLGGMTAVHQYRANIAIVERPNDINTADPFDLMSIPRLDWSYLLTGLTGHVSLARALSLALCVSMAAWIAYAALRTGVPKDLRTLAVFLCGFVSLGTVAVYHHQYDAALFVVPFLLLALTQARRKESHTGLWLMFPLALLVTLLPIARVEIFLIQQFGLVSVGYFNMAFPVTVTLTTLGSLLMIAEHSQEFDPPFSLKARRRSKA